MSSPLTHERCSELLANYLSRELDPEQHRLVEDHLEHCAQCSAERAGLVALSADAQDEGLTGDERAILRAGVLEAIRDPSAASSQLGLGDEFDAVVVPLRGRGSRASKYLGIAAMLAILAVGSLFVFRGGGAGMMGSGDSDGGEAVSNAEGSSGASRDEDAAGEEAAPEGNRAALGVRPRFQSDRGEISEADLDGLGRQTVLSLRSTMTFNTKSQNDELGQTLADRAPEASLDRLAARAPEALASAVAECGGTALADLGEPGLATYATTATIEGDDAIIIGFVTGGRTPDRYAVFAFPRGDCTTILTSTEGPLE